MAVTQQHMEVERNKELVRRAYDALNRGDIDGFGQNLSEDFREITQDGRSRGKAECLAEFRELKKAMPDVRYEIQDIIAEGDKVAVVEDYSGTMTSETEETTPVERRMSVVEVDVYRIKDGKLAEVRSVFDTASVMDQLGLEQ